MPQYECPIFVASAPNPIGGMGDRVLARLPGTDHDGTTIPAGVECAIVSDDGETMVVETDAEAPSDWTAI